MGKYFALGAAENAFPLGGLMSDAAGFAEINGPPIEPVAASPPSPLRAGGGVGPGRGGTAG